MKKTITLLSILFFCVSISFSQTAAKPKISPDLVICDKVWHVVSVEEWGVVNKPDDKTKNDMLKLGQDGKFSCVMFGISSAGTWKRSGQSLYFTDSTTKKTFSYKVLIAEANKLKVDHYSDEQGHSIFEYEVKP
jgi:hypothetical protein